MSDKKQAVLHAFYILCTVIPFALAAILAMLCLTGTYERIMPDHTASYYSLPPMDYKTVGALYLCGMALAGFLIIRGASGFCEKRLKTGFWRESFCILVVFSLTFLTRFFLIFPFENSFHPFSDFNNVWELAHGNLNSLAYYTLFPAYLNFATFEKTFNLCGEVC